MTSRLSRVLLALTVVSVAALAQVRPKGAVVGEAVKPLPALAPPPAPVPAPAAATTAGLGYQIVEVSSPIAPGQQLSKDVSCPPGKKVVGGGPMVGGSFGFQMVESYPARNGAYWTATVLSAQTRALTVIFYAICINAS